MVVHFGGYPDEYPFDKILNSNIIGCYNIWEAAYRNKLKRVVYANLSMQLACIQKMSL